MDAQGQIDWTYLESNAKWTVTQDMRPKGCQGLQNCWMRLKIPNLPYKDPVFFTAGIDLVGQFFIDREKVFETGIIRQDGKATFKGFHYILFPLEKQQLGRHLYLRLYSNHANIGIFLTGSSFNEHSSAFLDLILSQWDILLMITVMSIIGILTLSIGILSKNKYGAGYLGLFCFSTSFSLVGVPIFPISQLFVTNQTFLAVGTIAIPAICSFNTLFLLTINREYVPRFLEFLAKGALVFTAASGLLITFNAVAMNFFILPTQLLMISTLGIQTTIITKFALRGDRIAILYAISIAGIFLLVFYDVISGMGYLPWRGLHSHWGALFVASALIIVSVLKFRDDQRQLLRKIHLDQEIGKANKVQDRFNQKGSNIRGMNMAFHYQSAHDTGGDWFGSYYDPFNERVFLLCADVTGHGLPAAMITGVAKGSIETILEPYLSNNVVYDIPSLFHHIIETLHSIVLKIETKPKLGMTLGLVCLDIKSGLLTCSSAGHTPLMIYSGEKTSTIPCPGSPLGLFEQSRLKVNIRTRQLMPGDLILMYTDGLFENTGPDGAAFNHRALRSILEASNQSAEQTLKRITSRCKDIWQSHPQEDDCTIVLYQYLGVSEANRAS